MLFIAFMCICCLPWMCNSCFYNMMHNPVGMSEDDPPYQFGEPLFLTPMIENGELDRAKHISRVGQLPNCTYPVESYSGYLTVNKTYDSNLFFWFFPALRGDNSAPIVVWLQGGPGISSLIGVLVEHGPFVYDPVLETLKKREYSWSETLNVLYIDNPVGTGFSFTRNDNGYARNQTQIASELMNALNQFFTMFREYKGNNVYLVGEGYACKYVVTLAKQLHASDGGPGELELKGIAIGNGICEPTQMTNSTDFYYHLGLIDKMQATVFKNLSSKADNYISRNVVNDAVDALKTMFLDQTSKTSYFREVTGMENLYDIRYTTIPPDLYLYTKYLATAAVRKALHVGMMPFNNHKKVCSFLNEDIINTVVPHMEVILDNYKVMMYHGHLDALVPFPSMANFIRRLKWKRAAETPNHIIWTQHVNKTKKLAGYVSHIGDFYSVMVWKAGHFASLSSPEAVYDMFQRFIWGKSFH